MVRFDFSFKKGQVIDVYESLENVRHEFELRYGVFRQGTAYAEIVTLDEGQNDIKAVLNNYGIKYGLERILQ